MLRILLELFGRATLQYHHSFGEVSSKPIQSCNSSTIYLLTTGDLYDRKIPQVQIVDEEHDHGTRVIEREQVMRSKILHSVKGKIGYGRTHNPQDMTLFHGILTSCPNVKRLDLNV